MFRNEALTAQKQKLHGDVFLAQPIAFSTITFLVVFIVAVAATLLFTGSYARSERVAGYLVPSKGLVKIQASQFGSLQELHIHEGDTVVAGQVLAKILLAHKTSDGSSFVEKSLEALSRQKAILSTQVDFEKNQLESELNKLASERSELSLRIASLKQQILLQGQITASAEAAYKNVQQLLNNGHISEIESQRRHQTWLAQQMQEKLKRQELSEVTARLEQLDIRLTQLPTESKQRLANLQTQASELDGRIVNLESRRAYIVTSPVNGRIVSIVTKSPGRTVQAGQPLLAILPSGSELVAELFVPSRAVGFVEQGQEVRLLYDAFPYQRFGSYSAVISDVTETILAPGEILAPFEVDEPVYRVTAALVADKITAKGKDIALQNGMTLQANIVLERRSFLDWLLEPLRSVVGLS